MRVEPAPRLGGDDNVGVAALLQHPRDQPLGAPCPVDVGSVEKVDAGIESRVQSRLSILLRYIAPAAADSPCPKADLSDLPAGISKRALLHCQVSSLSCRVEQFASCSTSNL